MPVTWTDKKGGQYYLDHKLILDRMEPARRVQPDGTVGFDYGPIVSGGILALSSVISFSKEVPEFEKTRITRLAILEAGKIGPLSSNNVIDAVDRLQSEYLSQVSKTYLIATSLSMRHFTSLRTRRINGLKISFYRQFPRYFDFEETNRRAERDNIQKIPDDYCRVVISVESREAFAARDRAIQCLDFLRGIWNLSLNWGPQMRFGSARTAPINKIIGGPIQTIHHESGELADTRFWFEPNFPNLAPKAVDMSKWWATHLTRERDIRRKIKKTGMNEIEDFVVGYSRALDLGDHDSSYLSLWRLLEWLTFTGENENYGVTVQRAVFLWSNRQYHKQILNYLRRHRNQVVHAGEQSGEISQILEILRLYVEQLLSFCIINPFSFRSRRDFIQFYDLPFDISELRRQIKFRNQALNYFKSISKE